MSYRYFKNDKCEYFPCHKKDTEFFNCLFCYCPLYQYDCKGNYTDEGIKDCSNCLIPHAERGYDHVMKILLENLRIEKKD